MQLCTDASPRRHKINYCRCLFRSCLRIVCLFVDIMRVFSGILIQLGQLVNSKQLMVSQDNVLSQDPRVIQEGLCPDKPKTECTACSTLHQVGEYPATSSVCFKCNKQGHFFKVMSVYYHKYTQFQ